jgi:uncharacterized delta-60 repeat protein
VATSIHRVASFVYLGCVLVAAACSAGGPGLLDGGGIDLDGSLPNVTDADDGGLDATVIGSRDSGRSDALAALDASHANDANNANDATNGSDAADGSVIVPCSDASVYPDAFPSAAAFALDNAYGTGGVTAMNFTGPGSTYAAGMARQPDGKLLLGLKVGWNSYTVGVARFLSTGAIDAAFGTNGVAFVPLGSDATIAGVLLQSTGKIVLAGQSEFFGNSSNKAWLVRFDATGAPDMSFGTSGKVILDASVGAAALQADDSILVTAYRPGTNAPTVGRFTPNGALDSTFGSGGWASNTGLTSMGSVDYPQAVG